MIVHSRLGIAENSIEIPAPSIFDAVDQPLMIDSSTEIEAGPVACLPGRSYPDWLKPHVMCMIIELCVYRAQAMRTNIVIDDALMEEALKTTGLHTKKEAVEMGLKTLIRLKKQERIRNFRGKLSWEGDLSEQRTTR